MTTTTCTECGGTGEAVCWSCTGSGLGGVPGLWRVCSDDEGCADCGGVGLVECPACNPPDDPTSPALSVPPVMELDDGWDAERPAFDDPPSPPLSVPPVMELDDGWDAERPALVVDASSMPKVVALRSAHDGLTALADLDALFGLLGERATRNG